MHPVSPWRGGERLAVRGLRETGTKAASVRRNVPPAGGDGRGVNLRTPLD